jgi:hypothetical protein
MFLALILSYFGSTLANQSCENPYCPPGSTLEEGQWCWWLAEPGSYWVCNGTDVVDPTFDECVNAYPYTNQPCAESHRELPYHGMLQCVEVYNQTESECPQGYTLDVPGEGGWTCDMWTEPLCNTTQFISHTT